MYLASVTGTLSATVPANIAGFASVNKPTGLVATNKLGFSSTKWWTLQGMITDLYTDSHTAWPALHNKNEP